MQHRMQTVKCLLEDRIEAAGDTLAQTRHRILAVQRFGGIFKVDADTDQQMVPYGAPSEARRRASSIVDPREV